MPVSRSLRRLLALPAAALAPMAFFAVTAGSGRGGDTHGLPRGLRLPDDPGGDRQRLQ
jgi:hypothetical protein